MTRHLKRSFAVVHRREFIGLMAAASVAPLVARAQPADAKLVGLLALEESVPFYAEGLAREGWIVGENVRLERRDGTTLQEIQAVAYELVALQPDVICSLVTQAAQALLRATTTIPIVFQANDPLGLGIVDNLARPGGNATGFYYTNESWVAKQIEYLLRAAPNLTSIGFVYDEELIQPMNIAAFEEAAVALGFAPARIVVRNAVDYDSVIGQFAGQTDFGLAVDGHGSLYANRVQLVEAIANAGIPAVYPWPGYADVGGLMVFGADPIAVISNVGAYAGRILNGESISDLPVQASTDFSLILNQATAAAQGVTFPPDMLAIATGVIG